MDLIPNGQTMRRKLEADGHSNSRIDDAQIREAP